MIRSVAFLGLATAPAVVGGPAGPLQVVPDGEDVIAVFRIAGWSSDEDEAHGFRVLQVMEQIGQAVADDSISAAEAAQILAILDPRLEGKLDLLIDLADRVFAAVSDDGKISRGEALQLVLSLASSVLRSL